METSKIKDILILKTILDRFKAVILKITFFGSLFFRPGKKMLVNNSGAQLCIFIWVSKGMPLNFVCNKQLEFKDELVFDILDLKL